MPIPHSVVGVWNTTMSQQMTLLRQKTKWTAVVSRGFLPAKFLRDSSCILAHILLKSATIIDGHFGI